MACSSLMCSFKMRCLASVVNSHELETRQNGAVDASSTYMPEGKGIVSGPLRTLDMIDLDQVRVGFFKSIV